MVRLCPDVYYSVLANYMMLFLLFALYSITWYS